MRGYSIPEAEKRALAAAWAVADYRAQLGSRRLRLVIGRRAPALERAWPGPSYCLVTAYNPPPGVTADGANRAANRRLARLIHTRGWPSLPAEASDGHGGWREPGWLVRGLSLSQACTLGLQFGQGGVLFWRHGACVQLSLLWHLPADGACG